MPKRQSNCRRRKAVASLPVLRSNVAGIDIGSRSHYVAGPVPADGKMNVREFGTTTAQLQEMVDWLREQGVESVAMESTSVYWIPAYELLELHGFEVLLVNSRQVSNVPGRKTDVQDCQWIRLLHSCGLLRGSFRPAESVCVVRSLKRQWDNLVKERTKAVQWMQKALDQMNVQIHRAVTDLTGKTGMAIVRAIVAGERDPRELVKYRDRRCKKSPTQLAEYLVGTWRDEHLFNLAMALRLYDQLEEMIGQYEQQILQQLVDLQPPERRDEPVPPHPSRAKEQVIRYKGGQEVRDALWRLTGVDLTRIDGIKSETALVVVTELGFDLGRFPTEKHFISWLRLAPRQSITGGKPIPNKKSANGSTRLSSVLRMAALAMQQSKSALGAYYRRIARRRCAGIAVYATARKLATLIYRMLRYGQDYVDVGERAYEARYEGRRLDGLKAAIKSLGYTITPLEPADVVSG